MTREIKADTHEIRNDTSAIKQDTTQILDILAEIARLQEQLPQGANQLNTSGFMLQRYLDNLTSYAETVCDTLSDEPEVRPEREGSLHLEAILSDDDSLHSATGDLGAFWINDFAIKSSTTPGLEPDPPLLPLPDSLIHEKVLSAVSAREPTKKASDHSIGGPLADQNAEDAEGTGRGRSSSLKTSRYESSRNYAQVSRKLATNTEEHSPFEIHKGRQRNNPNPLLCQVLTSSILR